MENKIIINAGGSRTLVAVFDGKKREGLFGGANINMVGMEGVRTLVRDIAAFVGASDLKAKLLSGFAGASRPSDWDAIADLLKTAGFSGDIKVTSDFDLYLRALDPGVPLLLSGTGCLGAARVGDKLFRVGGWGPLSGERGGGLQLGRDAILCAELASEGRLQPTALVEAVPQALGLESIEQVVKPLHRGEFSSTKIAALTLVVGDLARKGDTVCKELISEVGRSLGSIVNALEERLLGAGRDSNAVDLALAGGLFEGDGRDLFVNAILPHLKRDYEFKFFGRGSSDINLIDILLTKI